MNNELNLNDMAITIEVDSGVIEDVRNGEIRHIAIDINGDNQDSILETVGDTWRLLLTNCLTSIMVAIIIMMGSFRITSRIIFFS